VSTVQTIRKHKHSVRENADFIRVTEGCTHNYRSIPHI